MTAEQREGEAVFAGPGEARAACRSIDWAATPLGPVHAWPSALRAVVALCLDAALPTCIYAGAELALVCNDAFVAELGPESARRVLGRPAHLAWGGTWRRLEPDVRQALAGGRVRRDDHPLALAGRGRAVETWWIHALSPIRDDDGRVLGVVHVLIETTARAVAEAALRESEAQYRLIVEGARDYAIFTADEDGRITSWSSGAEAVYGWTAAEAVGMAMDETFTPQDRARGVPAEERATARAAGAASNVRWHVRRDGARVFIDGVTRVLAGPDGGFRAYLKIGQDVTQRRRIEEALREAEERFRLVANLAPGLLWQSESGGWTSWYNERWYTYTGQTPDEAIGFGWLAAIHPEDREPSREAYVSAMVAGRSLVREHRLRGADGTYRWFLMRTEPFRAEDGRIVQWFGAASEVQAQHEALALAEHRREMAEHARREVERAVTERTAALREANAALAAEVAERTRAEAERSVLLRQLSSVEEEERRRIARELHDQLGQHLTALGLLLADLRARLGDPPAAHQRLLQLEALAQAMTRDARHLALELRPPELDDVGLASAVATYVGDWSARYGVAAELAFPGATGTIPTDVGSAAFRIVQEALTNVARHAAATHVSVILERQADELRLIVEDDGRGFDVATTLQRASRERRLGLAGMHERAARFGGGVMVESVPGQGATLFARLRLGASRESAG